MVGTELLPSPPFKQIKPLKPKDKQTIIGKINEIIEFINNRVEQR